MSAVLPSNPANDSPAKAPSAAERLAESRERLRQYMLRGDGRHEARRRNATANAQGDRASPLDKLRAMPVLGVVIDALSAWWANHPLHPAATVAEDVLRETAAPLARKHPLLMMAGAFTVGAAVAWFKPWRLLGKTALFAGLFSQIVSRVVTQMPWESVLGAMTSFAHSRSDISDDPVATAPNEPASTEEAVGMKEAA